MADLEGEHEWEKVDGTFSERVRPTAVFSMATASGGEAGDLTREEGRTPKGLAGRVASFLGRFQCPGLHQQRLSLVKCQGGEGVPWLYDERGGMMLKQTCCPLTVARP